MVASSIDVAPRRATRVSAGLAIAGASLVVVLASASGLALKTGDKTLEVLPIAFGSAALLAVLACIRFRSFVLLLLVARASLDVAKLTGRSAGNASSAQASRALDPASLLAVLFLATAVLWLLAQWRESGSLPGSGARRSLLVFQAACVISVLASGQPGPSLLEAARILAAVLMFIVLEQLLKRPGAQSAVLAAVFISAAFPVTLVAYGLATGTVASESKGSITRITGTFRQSNDFGVYLMLILIMGVAVLPHVSRRLRKPLAVLDVAVAGCLVLTYTRSALIGAVLGLLIVGIFKSRAVLVALVVAGVISVGVLPTLASRFSTIGGGTTVNDAGHTQTDSLTWRLAYWTTVLPLANRSPLIGIGLGETQSQTDKAKQPHNDFVRAYVETGVLGLLSYIAVHFALLRECERARRRTTRGTLDHAIAVGALGCGLAILAVSMVANVLSGVANLWYYYAFVALAATAGRMVISPVGPLQAAPPGLAEQPPGLVEPVPAA